MHEEVSEAETGESVCNIFTGAAQRFVAGGMPPDLTAEALMGAALRVWCSRYGPDRTAAELRKLADLIDAVGGDPEAVAKMLGCHGSS